MIFSNNGERCTAGSRIIVQQTIYDKFVADFAARAARLTVGDPLDPNTIVGPMVSHDHWRKVTGYIELGRQEGARLVCGGGAPDLPAHLEGGNWVQPTVFADVDNKMKIAQDEIFGPVPCLIPFEAEEDAVRIANDTVYGLSSYLWTNNTGRALRLARAIESGMTFVNSQNVRDLRQPFGGTKASGTGREGNHYSFEVFCEAKNVAVSYGSHPIPRWGV
jgi:5-carboxymethyl-2-hydroxymuconic-semialdehyde dehydrogenase